MPSTSGASEILAPYAVFPNTVTSTLTTKVLILPRQLAMEYSFRNTAYGRMPER